MFIRKFWHVVIGALLSGLSLGGCKVADMRQHEDLVSTTVELPVAGRRTLSLKKDFRIGSFAVQNVRRGWTNSSGYFTGVYEARRVTQRFEFVLRDSSGIESYVACQAGLTTKEIKLGKVFSVDVGKEDNREIFVSNIPSREKGLWQLILKDPGPDILFKGFLGVLRNGEELIEVEPVYDYQSKYRINSGEILGYEFKAGQELLASVQVIGKGRVWLKKDLSPDHSRVLGAAAASLLLYRKLNRPDPAEPQNAKVKLPLSLLN